MRDKWIIILSASTACFVLYWLTQIADVNYLLQTIFKVAVFITIPMMYYVKVRKIDVRRLFEITLPKPTKIAWLFAISTFTIILIAYYSLGSFVDFDLIANELTEKSQITPDNFLFVGLYITFGNSFVEEFFFRGFIFKNLYHLNDKKTAYLFSSLLFSIYHISIFQTWFDIWLVLLCLISLFSVGLLFNWLNTKSNGFINSWLVHIFADAAIIIIGFIMFSII
ncbi:CPBP family intramembrane glutamic endopeptidase [Aquibacillus rhizosphaerae]|uniref:CPBP family intramembrane metalloprotease n=1 Tax=Aquibacillus rhizosphaerae TaxID=3051431 RepID=A0ABT7L4R2_9BACI|nr:CPBP family intramembrane glutamic endopeptidase [Aquibacillus sp. LR5S19]MDL4840855.1 CPBP family intramembrane metalloprotease [Aquibacillus sp. LR5S19]